MQTMQERWIDSYPNTIPLEIYAIEMKNGEECGLEISLHGKNHQVRIQFGLACAVQMLDEGIELNIPQGCANSESFLAIRDQGFPSTLYILENSCWGNYIKSMMGEDLYTSSGFREYCIVTRNYTVYIISQYNPQIIVSETIMTKL